MSWQGYVDQLIKTDALDGAAIVGLDDGLVYAHSPGFSLEKHAGSLPNELGEEVKVSIDELAGLLHVVKHNGNIATPPGFWLNKVRYVLVEWRDDINTGYYKCKDGGATVAKTTKLAVVGTWSQKVIKGRSGGRCNEVIENIAHEFIKAQF